MSAKAVLKENRHLHHAATTWFGNWRKAMAAAGLNPNAFRKRYQRRVLPSSSQETVVIESHGN
jgi:hypothetical protein